MTPADSGVSGAPKEKGAEMSEPSRRPDAADAERIAQGIPRTAYTPCAWDGCERSPANKDPLFRVNPTGETGIFMCAEHKTAVDAPPREPR